MPSNDHQLLRAYVEAGSQEAFRELVARHADLVSRIVHKRLEDSEIAKDTIQEVFCCFARKASRLVKHPTVTGWLVRVAVLESAKAQRREINRMKRESVHAALEEVNARVETYSERDYLEVEEALAALPVGFRDAIMLRYYQREPFKIIGQQLGKSEDAAQKFVSRGMVRLRKLIGRSEAGTAGLLASALVMRPSTAEAAQSISFAAMEAAAAKVPPTLLLTVMTANQLKLLAGLGLAATIPMVYQWHCRTSSAEVEAPEARVANSSGDQEVTSDSLAVSPSPLPLKRDRDEPKTPTDWRAQRFTNLIADLTDEEWKIRRGAAGTLKGSDVPGELAVPALAKALADEEWQVRKEVALALESYGEEAKEAVPALIEAMSDEEWQVRNASAMALVSNPNNEAVSALSKALADEQWHVAANAGTALGAIGAEASEATADLMQALEHEQWHVRSGAAYALGSIGDSDAIEPLRAYLNDEEEQVVKAVRQALDALGDLP